MIKIHTEKLIERGDKKYKIVSVSALKHEELPRRYTQDRPHCWMSNDGSELSIWTKSDGALYIDVGKQYIESDMKKRLRAIRDCGARLHDINKELAKDNADWEGTETFCV